MISQILSSFVALGLASNAFASVSELSMSEASEPAYCQLANFQKLERGNNVPQLERAHVYQIGKLTLAGLAVGDSDYRYVQSLAKQYGHYAPAEKSCVFYFNNGNKVAEAAFTHQYAPFPFWASPAIAIKYDAVITPLIDRTEVSMANCAEDHHFVAMGCDGMRHRGPSVFAMFLAYSGCSAEHATEIANAVWGTNHVPTKTRTAIAQKGADEGDRNPAGRARLQALMTAK